MHQRKAIVAATEDIAEQYRDAFGLRREEWSTFAYASAVTGKRYDRLVVIRPHWRLTAPELTGFENDIINQRWRSMLAAGAILQIL